MTDFRSAIYSFSFRPVELRKEPSSDLDWNLVCHIAIAGHGHREA
jgi:hypothetical protein